MGYGGSRANAAEHLGKSGDEGVDGCINQDPLGLDEIDVQAKRYAPDNVIDRKTIQAFVGSMTGQGVTKGIFNERF
jgi:restriction system protein